MKRFMITAMASGSGKTVLTCALLTALAKRGIDVEAFKSGPDYIDPMFHRRALGIPSRNLDLHLQGEAGVLNTLARRSSAELAVIEGAMGFYDGISGTDQASAWHLSCVTGAPAVLAVRPRGASITLAAQIAGMMSFRNPSNIAAVILCDCKPMMAAHIAPIIERECGIPVLGYLPPLEEARFESRHLGLMTASEIERFSERMNVLSAQAEETIGIDALLALASDGASDEAHCAPKITAERATIAVAADDAFCFYYQDSLDALREAGAKLVEFSPLHDASLPEADGIYLGGGYPELHARALGDNASMRASIKTAIEQGMPCVAECGGFMYLQQEIEDDTGASWPAVGVFDGRAFRTERLQRFGYATMTADQDSLLLRAGERVPFHEFHYWDCTETGDSIAAEKPNGKTWEFGFATPTLYAGYPHLHMGGQAPLAQRFVDAAVRWRAEQEGDHA